SPAEQRLDHVLVDSDACLIARRDAPCDLARDLAQLTLELADTGFTRVLADHALERRLGDLDLVVAQAVLLALPRQQVPARDLLLLQLSVAGELDGLHAAEQPRRDLLGVAGRRSGAHHGPAERTA